MRRHLAQWWARSQEKRYHRPVVALSMSLVLMRVSRGMESNKVVEVEVVCRDGSFELGETVDVEGGFSSIIREVVVV